MRITPAGELRKVVSFQRASTKQDSVGQPESTWSTYYTTRAKVDVLRGQLLYQSDVFINKNTYQIAMRFPPAGITISVADRLVCGGEVYVIQAVINVEQRNRELHLLAYVVNDTE